VPKLLESDYSQRSADSPNQVYAAGKLSQTATQFDMPPLACPPWFLAGPPLGEPQQR
jgi:hypothetical protein